jgi:urease beta subunit
VAYLGSHFDLSRASAALEFDRRAATGARIDQPSGATIRIAAGETIELDLIWD